MNRTCTSTSESEDQTRNVRQSDSERISRDGGSRPSRGARGQREVQRRFGNAAIQRLAKEGAVGDENTPSTYGRDRSKGNHTGPSADPAPLTSKAGSQIPMLQRLCDECRKRARAGKPINCEPCEAKLQRSDVLEGPPSEPHDRSEAADRADVGLSINDPNDRYEREAESVAEAVLNGSTTRRDTKHRWPGRSARADEAPTTSIDPREGTRGPAGVQRMCDRCSARLSAGKPLNCPECEEELRRKPARSERGGRRTVTGGGLRTDDGPSIADSIAAARGTGRQLPDSTRRDLEPQLGYDLGDVRIHTGPRADELSRSLNARAFTYGSDVFFASGEYRPASRRGRRLLAHELTHTIQQGAAEPFETTESVDGSWNGPRSATDGSAEMRRSTGTSDQWEVSSPHYGTSPGPARPVLQRAASTRSSDSLAASESRSTRSSSSATSSHTGDVGHSTRSSSDSRETPATTDDSASDKSEERSLFEQFTEAATDVGSDLLGGGDGFAETQLQTLAKAMGAEMHRENGTIVIVASDVVVPTAMSIPETPLPTFKTEFPFLKGGVTVGAVTVIGTANLVVALDSSIGGDLKNAVVDTFRLEVDPGQDTVRTSGRFRVTSVIRPSGQLRLGLGGDLRAVITIPSEPPIPIVFPSLGLSGGIGGILEGESEQELSFTGSQEIGIGNVSMDLRSHTDLDLSVNAGLSGWGALELENYELCRLHWPLWSSRLDATIAQTTHASLEAGVNGFDAGFALTEPVVRRFDTGQLSDEAERNLFEEDCILCDVLGDLGWLPSQSEGISKYYLNTPILPEEVYPWDPGFQSEALCRGACGPDCKYCQGPQTRVVHGEDASGRPVMWKYDRFYECPTHAGCRDHDACYDWMMSGYSIDYPFGVYGPLHRLCDLECICDHSLNQCNAWRKGAGEAVMYFAEDVEGPVPLQDKDRDGGSSPEKSPTPGGAGPMSDPGPDRPSAPDGGGSDIDGPSVDEVPCPEPDDIASGVPVQFENRTTKQKGIVTDVDIGARFGASKRFENRWMIKYEHHVPQSRETLTRFNPAYDQNCERLYEAPFRSPDDAIEVCRTSTMNLEKSTKSVTSRPPHVDAPVPPVKAHTVLAYPLCPSPKREAAETVLGEQRLKGGKNWHRAHLINGRLGGPGKRWNLALVPQKVNTTRMPAKYEVELRKKVRGNSSDSYDYYWFYAEVIYHNDDDHERIGRYDDFVSEIKVKFGRAEIIGPNEWRRHPAPSNHPLRFEIGNKPEEDDLKKDRIQG